MNIKELGLSTRAYHILKRNFIDTVEQLEGKSREDLMNMPGVGFGTAYEIIARVKAVNTTNADHIRSMTDEELAHEIMCPYHIEPDMCNSVKTCNECCLDWLKQPYEEER